MKAKDNTTNQTSRQAGRFKVQKAKREEKSLSGYPPYPASDDIYNKYFEEKDINPEDVSTSKGSNEKDGTLNEKDFEDDVSGSDLDIPGAELDDNQENIGSEDEENNYYSLGGDNHNNLEEDITDQKI